MVLYCTHDHHTHDLLLNWKFPVQVGTELPVMIWIYGGAFSEVRIWRGGVKGMMTAIICAKTRCMESYRGISPYPYSNRVCTHQKRLNYVLNKKPQNLQMLLNILLGHFSTIATSRISVPCAYIPQSSH